MDKAKRKTQRGGFVVVIPPELKKRFEDTRGDLTQNEAMIAILEFALPQIVRAEPGKLIFGEVNRSKK